MRSSAVLSANELYRYSLTREWEYGGGRCLFIMLNPSTADASIDDATIRKCIGFAKRWGFEALDVGNLFAWRSRHPKVLQNVPDPVGPENDKHLLELASRASRIVVAWGNHGSLYDRGSHVLRLLRSTLTATPLCFRITKQGQPEHPLYQRLDAGLIEF